MVPDPRDPDECLFDDWEEGICTCGLGYPEEEVCSCGVQEKGKEYFKVLFLETNRVPEKVGFMIYISY